MGIDIGPRLRSVREREGVSQRALAKRSGETEHDGEHGSHGGFLLKDLQQKIPPASSTAGGNPLRFWQLPQIIDPGQAIAGKSLG